MSFKKYTKRGDKVIASNGRALKPNKDGLVRMQDNKGHWHLVKPEEFKEKTPLIKMKEFKVKLPWF